MSLQAMRSTCSNKSGRDCYHQETLNAEKLLCPGGGDAGDRPPSSQKRRQFAFVS
jgi:hypothetical protein